MDIVIVEDNKNICGLMTAYFEKDEDIEVIGVANNGIDGLNIIKENKPDVALIDIILPGKDGIAILEELRESELLKEVNCIVLTAVASEDITLKAFEMGAKYVMLKPCDLEILSRRIKEFNKKEDINDVILNNVGKSNVSSELHNMGYKKENIEKKITMILNEIGIMPNLKGYKYLRTAILMAFEDENLLDGITKFLYPDIAKANMTTHTRVERAIRHALEAAWDKGNGHIYYKILGYPNANDGKRPTNSEFIASMVDFLKINN